MIQLPDHAVVDNILVSKTPHTRATFARGNFVTKTISRVFVNIYLKGKFLSLGIFNFLSNTNRCVMVEVKEHTFSISFNGSVLFV